MGEIYSHTNALCTAFMCLKLGFVIFWQKDFGAKAAHKMLVKLTRCISNAAKNHKNTNKLTSP